MSMWCWMWSVRWLLCGFKDTLPSRRSLRCHFCSKNLSVCTKVYLNEKAEVGNLLSKCPIIRSRCSRHSINMHVYDIDGNNYRNIYCALCHNRSIRDIWFWNIDDNSVSGCPIDINGIAAASVKKEIVSIRGKSFRRCFAGDKCPQTYSNTSIVRLCSSYAYPVGFCSRETYVTAFKNPHCALCNGKEEFEHPENCLKAKNDFSWSGNVAVLCILQVSAFFYFNVPCWWRSWWNIDDMSTYNLFLRIFI